MKAPGAAVVVTPGSKKTGAVLGEAIVAGSEEGVTCGPGLAEAFWAGGTEDESEGGAEGLPASDDADADGDAEGCAEAGASPDAVLPEASGAGPKFRLRVGLQAVRSPVATAASTAARLADKNRPAFTGIRNSCISLILSSDPFR